MGTATKMIFIITFYVNYDQCMILIIRFTATKIFENAAVPVTSLLRGEGASSSTIGSRISIVIFSANVATWVPVPHLARLRTIF